MTRPRIAFLGVGWIGRHRMEAIVGGGAAEVVAICDPSEENRLAALSLAPQAAAMESLDDLLMLDLDGLVIATPSALHAGQSIRALEAGLAVFCQKPLGRTAAEVSAVVAAARTADRLLDVDLSYRHVAGMGRIAELVRSGSLGRVHAIDLTFHNAYGPDKAWFYDPAQSGGGCVVDLGVHLVDLALWALDFPEVETVSSALFAKGEPLVRRSGEVEDYGVATLRLKTGAVVRIVCSWRLHAGCEAVISAEFFGTEGGARLRNVDGSFHDFIAELYRGTACERLASPPDAWGGRAASCWARQLAKSPCFDPAAEKLIDVADVLDRIYADATHRPRLAAAADW